MHSKTPLIQSQFLEDSGLNKKILFKMDAYQPIGSFKIRGIGYACKKYHEQGRNQFISSSGGNAGIATAYAGSQLNVSTMVVVPETTKRAAIKLIKSYGAKVVVKGSDWSEANDYALSLVNQNSDSVLIHPFDDPLIWEGHSSIIDEVIEAGTSPDLVIVSVGGGGLLNGILQGLHRNQLKSCPVFACETNGTASFKLCKSTGKHKTLDAITGVATSLGARQVSEATFDWISKHPMESLVFSDEQAIEASRRFLNTHRTAVEVACGASLCVPLFKPEILKDYSNILIIVCGGVSVEPVCFKRLN